MGNLVNYIEVGDQEGSVEELNHEDQVVIHDEKSAGDGYERMEEDDEDGLIHEPVIEYGSEIPSVFTDPEVMDRFVSSDYVTPPQLPPHLEGVILNSNSTEKDNNSVLPIPNHVVLNHLATTSIKHNVLAVASISRYSRKYVTQILYAPL
jgi:5'-AMP-activated protein kinase, regulatory beta subunit